MSWWCRGPQRAADTFLLTVCLSDTKKKRGAFLVATACIDRASIMVVLFVKLDPMTLFAPCTAKKILEQIVHDPTGLQVGRIQ